MNNITIELCAEDRARIDNLIVELARLRHTLSSGHVTAVLPEPQEAAEQFSKEEAPKTTLLPKPQPEEPKAEAPQPEAKPEEKAAPEPTPTAPEVTVADLQAKVVQLVNAGKKTETREIILKYAPNVGSIPAEKRAEVLGLLNGLEG